MERFFIEYRETYIYVRHADPGEAETVADGTGWSAVADMCAAYRCPRVLSEGEWAIASSISDAYHSALTAARYLRSVKVAWCHDGDHPSEALRFFELAVSNRGVSLKIFKDRAEAFRWLGAVPTDQERSVFI